jgi:anti-sigma B factor antagonist
VKAAAEAVEIDVTRARGATVVRPEGGRLDLDAAAQFRARLHQLIQSGHRNLVIDLSEISFIDSSGLGALVSALKLLKNGRDRRRSPRFGNPRRGGGRGDVRLAAVQPPVRSLLEVIRLDRVFPSFASVDAAVTSYKA